MRELAQTAWMHIRARMVTPSTPTERSAAGRLPEWGTDAYPEPMPGLAAEAGEAAEAKERFRAASR